MMLTKPYSSSKLFCSGVAVAPFPKVLLTATPLQNNLLELYGSVSIIEILKLLQRSYLGTVRMIDIDPPYSTGNDFIYPPGS